MQSSSPIGGVETWLDRACAHLAAHGFDPLVALVRGQKYNQPDIYRKFHPTLPTVEVDGRGLNREGRVRALARCIRRAGPSVVLPLGIVDANEAVIRRKQAGDAVRLLAHAQGNLETMLADLRTYRDWIDRVVCPGRLTQKVLVDWAGFAPGRVLNISNGADHPIVERNLRQPRMPLRLGYVGRLTQPDKRALDLIELCRSLERLPVNYTLDVIGDGPCRAELEIALAPWREKVRLRGAMPHDDLYREVYPNLDVLLLTSSSEAFGIVLVEAMMHGVVPVTSRYHGFHSERLVVDGETGLSFEVGDTDAAAAAVLALQDDPRYLARMSAAATARAEEYTWARSLSRWHATLLELCEEPPLLATHAPTLPCITDGVLERIGLPPGIIDGLRRLRRQLLGPAVAAGGEEWPLFHRWHSASQLDAVREAILRLDAPTNGHLVGVAGSGP